MKKKYKDIRKNFLFAKIIFKPLKIIANKLLFKKNYFLIWRTGKAIGDQVLITGFAKSLNNKYSCKVITISNYSSLLSLSPWITKSISWDQIICFKIIYYSLKLIEGERIIEYNFPFKRYGYKSQLEAYKSGFFEELGEPPIWQAHVADRFKREIFKDFTGGLEITNNGKAKLITKNIYDNYPNFKIGIINPVGKDSYAKSKLYGFENYQIIVKDTKSKIKWLQVGLKKDKVLEDIHLDLRGNTLEFLVNIISFSDLVLADEGLLNHIAGSFPFINSYVVFSKFSPPNYYSYKNTITIGKPKNFSKLKYWEDYSEMSKIKLDPYELAKSIIDTEF